MSYNPHVSRDPTLLRSGALTSSFDAAPMALRTQNWNQLVLYFTLALDSATDARVQIDVATPAGDDVPTQWHKLMWQDGAATSTSGGVTTVPGYVYEIKLSTSESLALPLPLNYKWVRIRAKATGTVGAATLSVSATTGMA